MVNHPNRSKNKTSSNNPTTEQVKAARAGTGLTQTQAAEVIYSTLKSWQNWEDGRRPMHPGLFELFLIKTKKTI